MYSCMIKKQIFHYFPHTCSISSISSLVRVRKEGLTEGPRFLCKSRYMKRLQRANANAQVLTLTKTILDTKEEDSDKYWFLTRHASHSIQNYSGWRRNFCTHTYVVCRLQRNFTFVGTRGWNFQCPKLGTKGFETTVSPEGFVVSDAEAFRSSASVTSVSPSAKVVFICGKPQSDVGFKES